MKQNVCYFLQRHMIQCKTIFRVWYENRLAEDEFKYIVSLQ